MARTATKPAHLPEAPTTSQTENPLRLIVEWGLAETDAWTLGDLIDAVRSSEDLNETWETALATPLHEITGPPQSAQQVLQEWASQQPPKHQAVFWSLVARIEPKTHTALARELGYVRSAIGQIEQRVRRKLHQFLQTDAALPVRWRVETVHRTIGTAMEEDTANQLLDLHPGVNPCRGAILDLAGPYRNDHGWLVSQEAAASDPTEEILRCADDVGQLDERLINYLLRRWGLEPERHRSYITRDGRVRVWRGRLVVWGKNAKDRAALALTDLGRPATPEEITDRAGVGDVRTLKNCLTTDTRFVRTGPKTWGLREWRRPEYLGIAKNMAEILSDRGEMPREELIRVMERTFDVNRTSLESFSRAALFVNRGKMIRLRDEYDGPRPTPRAEGPLRGAIFRLGERRAAWIHSVDHDHLRGSGRNMGNGLATILGLEPGMETLLRMEGGEEVMLHYPEASHTGATIGSIKRTLERLGAEESDLLTLVFDTVEGRLETTLTKEAELTPGWETVGRLTGIGPGADMEKLAWSLICPVDQVLEVLEKRGDREVKRGDREVIRAIPTEQKTD